MARNEATQPQLAVFVVDSEAELHIIDPSGHIWHDSHRVGTARHITWNALAERDLRFQSKAADEWFARRSAADRTIAGHVYATRADVQRHINILLGVDQRGPAASVPVKLADLSKLQAMIRPFPPLPDMPHQVSFALRGKHVSGYWAAAPVSRAQMKSGALWQRFEQFKAEIAPDTQTRTMVQGFAFEVHQQARTPHSSERPKPASAKVQLSTVPVAGLAATIASLRNSSSGPRGSFGR